MKISIIIPAKNESGAIAALIESLVDAYPDYECIVVNDGSTDDTAKLAAAAGAKVVNHPYSKGNGAAIKSGSRAATGDILLFMDGDGQHKVEDVGRLLKEILENDYDLVVGARDSEGQANAARNFANTIYNKLSSWMVGQEIKDLTSGMRAVKAKLFIEILYLLPNGFSYPTTSTMAFFRSGYSVKYVPIEVKKRIGKSHIKLFRDGTRFFLIIFKVATLFSPLKLFFPASLIFFALGTAWYVYKYMIYNQLPEMSVLLYVTSVVVFLMGLISEQITALMYKKE